MKGIILTDILKDLKSINFYYTNIAFYSNPTNFKKECSNLITHLSGCRDVGMSDDELGRVTMVTRVTCDSGASATKECD